MPWLITLLVLGALSQLPQAWANSLLKRNQDFRPDFPGSGGSFAVHLLSASGLEDVEAEVSPAGDHYDPFARRVRLSQENWSGQSLTAVVAAAHEVGHALQHSEGYGPLELRTQLAGYAAIADRVASVLLWLLPIAACAGAPPRAVMAGTVLLAAALLSTVAVHLVTLPVELDASFGRALPLLQEGGYLGEEDMVAARGILWACALTYVASALASVLNLWRRLVFRR